MNGLSPILLEQIRPHVSKGSRAMLAAAFPHLSATETEAMVPQFLETYLQELGRHSVLFADIDAMLVVAPYYTYRYYLLNTRIAVGNRPGGFEVSRDGRGFYFGNEPPAFEQTLYTRLGDPRHAGLTVKYRL